MFVRASKPKVLNRIVIISYGYLCQRQIDLNRFYMIQELKISNMNISKSHVTRVKTLAIGWMILRVSLRLVRKYLFRKNPTTECFGLGLRCLPPLSVKLLLLANANYSSNELQKVKIYYTQKWSIHYLLHCILFLYEYWIRK